MITGIGSNASQYVNISGGSGTSSVGYINATAQSAGMMRFNASTNQVEVYDGTGWRTMGSFASVDLTQRTLDIFRWAEQRMADDQRLQELIKDNPTVADAFNAYKDAQDKLQVVVSLVQNP